MIMGIPLWYCSICIMCWLQLRFWWDSPRNVFRMVTKILKPAWGLNAVCGPCFLSLPARFRGLQLCAWMECHWRFCRAVSYNWLPWSAKEEIKGGQEARYLRKLAIVLPQTYFLRFGGRCCQNPAKYNLSDELWNSDEASGRVGRGRRNASFHVLAKQCRAEPETVTKLWHSTLGKHILLSLDPCRILPNKLKFWNVNDGSAYDTILQIQRNNIHWEVMK